MYNLAKYPPADFYIKQTFNWFFGIKDDIINTDQQNTDISKKMFDTFSGLKGQKGIRVSQMTDKELKCFE